MEIFQKEQIKKMVCKILVEDYNLSACYLFEIGLIDYKTARRWLIERLYYIAAKNGKKYKQIKKELSIEFDVSVKYIENIIYR